MRTVYTPGSTVGRWRIEQEIGRGGQASVYRAVHLDSGEIGALKVLDSGQGSSPSARTHRFEREARVLRKIAHPNVVRFLDHGCEFGDYYICTEYVAGDDLRAYLRIKGRIPEKEAVEICRQVARGLREACNQGVIHRDIKPENLMLTSTGEVKILDFGIAKDLFSGTNLTRAGRVPGTLAYESPEQIEDRSLDFRADVWSLGVVFYELLTGSRPYPGGSDPAVIRAICDHPAPDPSRVTPGLSAATVAAFNKMNAKSPDDRPASYEDLIGALDDLDEALVDTDSVAPGEAPPTAGPRRRPRARTGGRPFHVPPRSVDTRGNPVADREASSSPACKGLPCEIHLDAPPMEFVLIPPGRFSMGSRTDEKGRNPGAPPPRKAFVQRPFYMGKYPVTQLQWETLLGQNPSFFIHRNRPVERVSWDDCRKFLEKWGQALKLPDEVASLPSDMQWEYACRAGTDTRFWCGQDEGELVSCAWLDANSGSHTHAVGEKRRNPLDLYDMHGNVWQWCADAWDPSFDADLTKTHRSRELSDSDYRVARGGSWFTPADLCRSAARAMVHKDTRTSSLGFRVVLSDPELVVRDFLSS